MNRRSFFRSIALIASGASLSPTIFIPKFEPVRWKRPIVLPHRWMVGEPLEQYRIIRTVTGRISSFERISLQSLPKADPTTPWMEDFAKEFGINYQPDL